MLYPEVSVVKDVAAELGWPAGTPRFPQTVLHDPATAALLRSAHQGAEHGDQLASSTLLRAALAGLLRAHAASGPAANPVRARRSPAAVRDVRDLLHERLADPPALAELAAMTGLSQFALLRAFRAATGLPPHAYLNQLRVRRARLLLDSGVPPADVAAQVGLRRPGPPDQALQARRRRPARGLPARAAPARRLEQAGKNVQDLAAAPPPRVAGMSAPTRVPAVQPVRPGRSGTGSAWAWPSASQVSRSVRPRSARGSASGRRAR